MSMDKQARIARAGEAFRKGYNCAQSLVYAFSDLTDIQEETLLALASSFGGGMGRLREVCGAVSGMFMICGVLYGYAAPETGAVKADHYARIQQFAKEFTDKRGTLLCRELLGKPAGADSPVPEARTEAYYASRPCEAIIKDAAAILCDYIAENPIIDRKQKLESGYLPCYKRMQR